MNELYSRFLSDLTWALPLPSEGTDILQLVGFLYCSKISPLGLATLFKVINVLTQTVSQET
jgi:hypothetical protein